MDKQKQLLIDNIRKRRKQKKLQQARHKAAAVVTIAAVAVSSLGFVYTASANEIKLTEINEFTGQNDTTVIKTHTNSLEKILEDNGVSVSEYDKVNLPIESDITEDTDVVITRGKLVTVKTKDGEQVVSVTKADAKEALQEAGIAVGDLDEITADGDRIEVVSVDEQYDIQTESVPFETEYDEDDTLPAGETKVKTEGAEGVKTLTYKVIAKDGAEVSRELISEDITDTPQNRVILKGTKTVQDSSSSGASESGNTIAGHRYSKKITMRATAYSTHPSENGGYTVSAMGNKLGHGIVAVDPSVVPLGSKVYVAAADGSWTYGIASAEDTGGAIKGNKIDLCYEGTVSEVNQFGVRDCVVYILAD